MSNALKIAEKLEITAINEQLQNNDNLIDDSLEKCDELIDRDWLDRALSNNTRDLGEIQQLQSKVIKGINRVNANALKTIIDNTEIQKQSLKQIVQFENTIQQEKHERENSEKKFKNEIELISKRQNDIVASINVLKTEYVEKFSQQNLIILKLEKVMQKNIEDNSSLKKQMQRNQAWSKIFMFFFVMILTLIFFTK